MKENRYSSLIIGQPSLDINTDYDGKIERSIGGAVVYSSYASASLGHEVAVVPKCSNDLNVNDLFSYYPNISIFTSFSATSTSISNNYIDASRETRKCIANSKITPYTVSDIPEVDAEVYHIAGLMYGDFEESLLNTLEKKSPLAVDVQAFIRKDTGNEMTFVDWKNKKQYLPLIKYLKTDAKEAQILTGTDDRYKAAKILYEWGSREIMITHNTEVLVYDGEKYYAEPILSRNFSGRTGRGDTCFSAYICERNKYDIPEALRTATALVSLKMESAGPFKGNRDTVYEYIQRFYENK